MWERTVLKFLFLLSVIMFFVPLGSLFKRRSRKYNGAGVKYLCLEYCAKNNFKSNLGKGGGGYATNGNGVGLSYVTTDYTVRM